MKFFKKLLWLVPLVIMVAGLAEAQQNTYIQSYGPVTSTVACTAATGVNTSAAIAPCGGQGGMFQNSLVTSMTLSWTSVATVSTCTVQLEQSSTGTGSWTLLGTAQTCTSSGSYTATLNAAYVRVNITALTTTTGTFQFNYFGAVPSPATTNILTSAMSCGTAAACSPTFQTVFRIVYGSCTAAAATTCTVTGIAPAFTSSTSYYCQASDATTIATTFKLTYASSSSIVFTTASSTSDVFNWICEGT
jgi:hypothetical protein